jgi:hypothetical protein
MLCAGAWEQPRWLQPWLSAPGGFFFGVDYAQCFLDNAAAMDSA